jgi:hypothetical protein
VDKDIPSSLSILEDREEVLEETEEYDVWGVLSLEYENIGSTAGG